LQKLADVLGMEVCLQVKKTQFNKWEKQKYYSKRNQPVF
jgi:hypothetical protein